MDLQLKDKIIPVTGGDKGIGYGICQILAEEGAIPVIIGRTRENVIEATERIQATGAEAFSVLAELTDPKHCKAAIQEIIKKYGRIDGLVNNAGVNDGISLENGSHTDFIKSLEKSLVHYYYMAHLALPYLKKSQGAIVNIGSKTSVTGQGGTSGYAAANGGRNALTREWAVELLPYKIRVNAIIVAECYTPQYKKWIKTFDDPEARLKIITDKIPLENRMTTEREIADNAAFLLSPRSSHTTGQLFFIDGGYVHLDRAL